MPKNLFQRMIFALITVVITVHCFVFYSIFVVNGATFMEVTGQQSVPAAIEVMGGISVFGTPVPVWAVILIEFCLAYALECLLGSPCSLAIVRRVFAKFGQNVHPMIFETAIITATVALMCPTMSLLAAFLYYPYGAGFDFLNFLIQWASLVCKNLPFAYFSQLLFIQPLVRTIFSAIFREKKSLPAAE